ncbi:hypothetical protein G6O67_006105 [Ophiocordyceps sinensis]|uniref:Uncharacterized protein n=1 Tax=Ophiocordyceps sinensis TaxID=72228 RepID=A0A8H4PMN5_9HYPO|nr:hypothetical protein G6O67_006105 [Ophiocordyceps sinensis]
MNTNDFSTGEHFNVVVKTTTGNHHSPVIRKLTPLWYMATDPATALRALIEWVKTVPRKVKTVPRKGMGRESDVVLVAHDGMNHDHVLLVKNMMIRGIHPPKWRLADSLLIFKLMIPGETATLDALAAKYAPWFHHIHHDGPSDATALMHVVTKRIPHWQKACMVFGNSSEAFIVSVGLNTLKVHTSEVLYKTAHLYRVTGLDSF